MTIAAWMVLAMVGVIGAAAGVVSAVTDLRWVVREGHAPLRFTAQSSLRKQVTILVSLVAFSVAGWQAITHEGRIGVPDEVNWWLLVGLFALVVGTGLDHYERKRHIRGYNKRRT